MEDLAILTAVVRHEWLLGMLREDRLAVRFQLIISVTNPGEDFAYECLLSGLDDRDALASPKCMYRGGSSGEAPPQPRPGHPRKGPVGGASELKLALRTFVTFYPASI